MKNKLRHLGSLPPRLMFYLFDSLVRPILLYGSDVWGHSCKSSKTIDKMFHWFIRCALKVKSTTSNVIVVGESGQIPPSVYSHINVLCYLERLQHLKPDMLVKQVYLDLLRLHNCGHNTWVTSVFELAQGYNLAIGIDDYDRFKKNCRLVLTSCFKINWLSEVRNDEKHPIIRTYSLHKREFCLEPYLDAVKDARYRCALTKLRASSHTLEIERGRYTVPKTPTSERVCSVCQEVEDEIHFLIRCTRYNSLRNEFFGKIYQISPNFTSLNDNEKYVFLMTSCNKQLMVWLGKFVHEIFGYRGEQLSLRNRSS